MEPRSMWQSRLKSSRAIPEQGLQMRRVSKVHSWTGDEKFASKSGPVLPVQAEVCDRVQEALGHVTGPMLASEISAFQDPGSLVELATNQRDWLSQNS